MPKKSTLATALALMSLPFTALTDPAVDFGDPAQAVEAWVKLKGDNKGAITYEWMTGTAYAIPTDSQSVALFAIESVTIRQFQRHGPGEYTEQTFACRLYRDLLNRMFVERWLNPYTGEEVDLKPGCRAGLTVNYRPAGVALDSDIAFRSTALGVPMKLEVVTAGDHVIIRREAHSEYRVSPAAELRRETAIDTFKVLSRYLEDQTRSHWLPQYQWTSVTQWMASLNMGDRPGRMLWSINGRNYLRANDLNEEFRQAVHRLAPDALQHRFKWD